MEGPLFSESTNLWQSTQWWIKIFNDHNTPRHVIGVAMESPHSHSLLKQFTEWQFPIHSWWREIFITSLLSSTEVWQYHHLLHNQLGQLGFFGNCSSLGLYGSEYATWHNHSGMLRKNLPRDNVLKSPVPINVTMEGWLSPHGDARLIGLIWFNGGYL